VKEKRKLFWVDMLNENAGVCDMAQKKKKK